MRARRRRARHRGRGRLAHPEQPERPLVQRAQPSPKHRATLTACPVDSRMRHPGVSVSATPSLCQRAGRSGTRKHRRPSWREARARVRAPLPALRLRRLPLRGLRPSRRGRGRGRHAGGVPERVPRVPARRAAAQAAQLAAHDRAQRVSPPLPEQVEAAVGGRARRGLGRRPGARRQRADARRDPARARRALLQPAVGARDARARGPVVRRDRRRRSSCPSPPSRRCFSAPGARCANSSRARSRAARPSWPSRSSSTTGSAPTRKPGCARTCAPARNARGSRGANARSAPPSAASDRCPCRARSPRSSAAEAGRAACSPAGRSSAAARAARCSRSWPAAPS